MWLLNVQTLKLEEFFGAKIPNYAILSHTWEKEEVSFQTFSQPHAEQMEGYKKIQGTCRRAIKDGYNYVWIDTCCIDKRSSAELSEAINSMYEWYSRSGVCYAYLQDVPFNNDPEPPNLAFKRSRWFTRGWTLQELLAPEKVQFYTKDWKLIGSKKELAQTLSVVTSIPPEVLEDHEPLIFSSVARRMSWAARRQTTRIEDSAYCLLGIFNVNMPLLYGEGDKAFVRLQEQILSHYEDQSLLAWDSDVMRKGFALSTSPLDFENAWNIVPIPSKPPYTPHAMTQRGLQISLPLHMVKSRPRSYNIYVGILECQVENDFTGPIGIYLKSTDDPGTFERVQYRSEYTKKLTNLEASKAKMQRIIIRDNRGTYVHPGNIFCLVKSDWLEDYCYDLTVRTSSVHSSWNQHTQTLQIKSKLWLSTTTAFIFSSRAGSNCFAILFALKNSNFLNRATTLIDFFDKPQTLDLEQWLTSIMDDRSAMHDPDRSSVLSGWRRSSELQVQIGLKEQEILNQIVHVLEVSVSPKLPAENPVRQEILHQNGPSNTLN